jgi:tetratricopeptide (TPR) repeat protein
LDIHEAIDNALLDIESGNADKAEPVLRSALSSLPKDSDATTTCLEKLAGACSQRGNYDDAIRLNIRLLHDLKVRYGETDERALNVMRSLIQLYRNVGKFGEADFLRSRLAALESKLVYDDKQGDEPEVGAPEKDIERPRWLRRALTHATDVYTRPQVNDASIQSLIDIVVPETKSASYSVPKEVIEAIQAGSSSGQFSPKAKAKIEKAARLAKAKIEKQKTSARKKLKGEKSEKDASAPNVMPLPDEPHGKTGKASTKDKAKTEPQEHGKAQDQKNPDSSTPKEMPSFKGAPSDRRQDLFYFIGDLLSKLRLRRNPAALPAGSSGFSVKRMIFGEPAPKVPPKTGRAAMEVPPERRLSDFFQLPKELEDRKKVVRRNIVIAVIFIAVLWFLPRNPTPNEMFAHTPVSYRTADGLILLRFEDLSKCKLDSFGTVTEWPTAMFMADWRDFVVINGAQLVQKQIWLTRTPQGLRTPSGVMFYGLGSPELQLTDLMKNLAERAKVYYARHGVYPEIGAKNIAYDNPYSGLKELPSFEKLYFYDAASRDVIIAQTREGRKWADQLKPHPGLLSACSATIKGPDGESKLFFIRAYGRDANLLTGSRSGTAYYLALQDGADLASTPQEPEEIVNRSGRSITYWRLEKGTNRICMFLISFGAPILFGIVSVAFIYLSLPQRLSKKRKRIYWVCAGLFGLIALMYLSSHFIP